MLQTLLKIGEWQSQGENQVNNPFEPPPRFELGTCAFDSTALSN